ncbi:MAG: bis(5'-nucleosyl)-tetraphosphatase (symmetrical) YqeK [Bacillota bacterium]|nr:bis(5'-nucleosyl)-tetraphosphatase (symmetrical) YqeK [Bacillota bacterium]
MPSEEVWSALRRRMLPRRFQHARRVAEAAGELALRFGANKEKAELAGALHDLARDEPPALLLQKAEAFGIVIDEISRLEPVLLHGPVGAEEARRELGVADEEVLRAIRLHTTGGPEMTRLDEVVFLADYIEPGRRFPGAVELRRLVAAGALEAALWEAARLTLQYVLGEGRPLHPATAEVYNAYLLRRRGAGE